MIYRDEDQRCDEIIMWLGYAECTPEDKAQLSAEDTDTLRLPRHVVSSFQSAPGKINRHGGKSIVLGTDSEEAPRAAI